jgi:hypothetical protein
MRNDSFRTSRYGLALLGLALVVSMVWVMFSQTKNGHDHSVDTPEALEPDSLLATPAVPLQPLSRIPLQVSKPEVVVPTGPTVAVEILVVSMSEGLPISGAAVMRQLPKKPHLLGYSGSDGQVTVRLEPSEVVPLLVAKEGYASNKFLVETEAIVGKVVIALAQSGNLEGVVLMPDGTFPPAGTPVLAWPSGTSQPSRSQVLRWAGGEASILAGSRTTETGTFNILGIDPTQSYRVVTAMEGYCSAVKRSAKAGKEIELIMETLLGAHLKIRDNFGGVPEVSLSRHAFPTGVPLGAGLTSMSGAEPYLSLCGIPALGKASEIGFDRLILYRSDEIGIHEFQISFSADVPGFQVVEADIPLSHILGEIPGWTILLNEVGVAARGIIRFEFQEYGIPEQGEAIASPSILTLSQVDGNWGWQFDVPSLARPLVLEGIPFGDYEYSFESDVQVPIPSEVLERLSGTLSLWSGKTVTPVSLRGMGAIELCFPISPGRLDGRFREFRLIPEEHPGAWAPIEVWGGLRRLEMVPAGNYFIASEDSAVWGERDEAEVGVRVYSGQVTRVNVVAPSD